jgi:hypothetical protein
VTLAATATTIEESEVNTMTTQAYDAATERSGWLDFAGIVLLAVGFFRIISAIGYFANSNKINDVSNGLFSSHLWAWGVWDLLIAGLAILAGISIFSNGGYGRVMGYIWGVLVIVQSFAVISYAPWYAATAIALGALVIYGLASTPSEAT